MCLLTLQDNFFVAEEDIVCYKRLVLDKNDRFVTPVFGRKIPDAVISGRRLYRARGIFRRAHKYDFPHSVTEVGKGWIHTYASEFNFFPDIEILFECVIPKGTRYWKSIYGTEYASSSIRFVKPCEKQIYALFSERMGRFPAEEELSEIVGSIGKTKEFFKKFA